MAIVKADCELWERLKAAGQLPIKPHVLEIGEANWYGDADWPWMPQPNADPFSIAKEYYSRILDYASLTAIDLQGTPAALPLDLNGHLDLPRRYGIVINTGTTEHVFDQRRVFQSIHDYCEPGGLIVHNAPHVWPEHGFYCYSQCFFDDIAFANGYELLVRLWYDFQTQNVTEKRPAKCEELGIHLAYRKTRDEPFKIPRQRSIGL